MIHKQNPIFICSKRLLAERVYELLRIGRFIDTKAYFEWHLNGTFGETTSTTQHIPSSSFYL